MASFSASGAVVPDWSAEEAEIQTATLFASGAADDDWDSEDDSDFDLETGEGGEEADRGTSFGGTDSVATTRIPESEAANLLVDDELGCDDIPVSYYNAQVINHAYKQKIQEQMNQLEGMLADNLRRQKQLDEDIYELHCGRNPGGEAIAVLGLVQDAGGGLGPAKRGIGVFAAPYFKDASGYTHAPNEDTIKMRQRGEIDLYIVNRRPWTEDEKAKLVRAVRDDALRVDCKGLNDKKEELYREIKAEKVTAKKKKTLKEEFADIDAQIDSATKMSDLELFFKDRDEEFDWMRISTREFHGVFTAKQCELMWKNLMHPKINKFKWTLREDKALEELAHRFETREWDEVARELNKITSGGVFNEGAPLRTGFQCFHRYQSKFEAVSQLKRRWTRGEDDKLRRLVAECRINNYVPWTKVSHLMERRTKEQCYQRFVYSLRDNLRKGAFNSDEDFVVMVGVKLFGQDWAKIVDFIPHRTPNQIHSRYNTFLKANFSTWTTEEDVKLLHLAKEFGTKKAWPKIAAKMGNKTRTQCRNRFNTICKSHNRQGDDFDLSKVKKPTLQRRRQDELYSKLNQSLELFIKDQEEARELPSASGGDVDGNAGAAGYFKGEFHETPDGKLIRKRDMFAFLFDLRSKLPSESATRAYDDDEDEKRPVGSGRGKRKTRTSSAAEREELGMLWSPGSKFVGTDSRGKPVTSYKRKKPGRPANDPESKIRRLDRALNQFFRPSWPIKKYRPVHYTTDDLHRLGTSAVVLSKVLKFDVDVLARLTLSDFATMDNRTIQLIDEVKRKRHYFQGAYAATTSGFTTPPGPPPAKKRKKTYGRATIPRAEAEVADSGSINEVGGGSGGALDFSFVPPNYSTLVGIRGLSLHNRYLMQLADPGGRKVHKFRPDTDETLKQGIFHPDVLVGIGPHNPATTTSDINSEAPSDEGTSGGAAGDPSIAEADRLLFDRLKSLLMWPCMMTTVQPPRQGHRDLFLDEARHDNSTLVRVKLAASKPYDASGIIREAQNMPPIARKNRGHGAMTMPVAIKIEPQYEFVEEAGAENDEARLMPPPATVSRPKVRKVLN